MLATTVATVYTPLIIDGAGDDSKRLYDQLISYVRKPVDFAEFPAPMKHLGFYWLLLNRIDPADA